MVLGAKSGIVSRKPPRSSATTCSPASVSSFARMLPVQPNPTIATSLGGSLFAMSCLPDAGVAAGDAHERHVELPAVLVDLRDVVVARAGEADELPADEVLVAAVDRIGEEAFDSVHDQDLEEFLAEVAGNLHLALLERVQEVVLRLRVELREGAVSLRLLEVLVDLRDRRAIELRGREAQLVALLVGARLPRPLHVP